MEVVPFMIVVEKLLNVVVVPEKFDGGTDADVVRTDVVTGSSREDEDGRVELDRMADVDDVMLIEVVSDVDGAAVVVGWPLP